MQNEVEASWAYSGYCPKTEADAFGALASIVALWQAKAPAPTTFPMWRDFDFWDFEGWWGQLSLAEMHRDPVDLRWVLWGTQLVEWWGAEYTNQFVSQQPYLGQAWEAVERPYLERLMDERLIGFVTGTLAPQDRDYTYIEGVDLPLERDGTITHIFSAYRLRDATREFVPMAPAVFTM